MNPENQVQSVLVPLGSITADGSIPAIKTNKKIVIKKVSLCNVATIAASDTDYCQVSLQSGSDVIAEIDTRAAHENGLTALEHKSLNLVAAEAERAADDNLKVVYNEEGTFALTNAMLQIDYYTP